MEQCQESLPQEDLNAGNGVASLESKTNGRASTDVSSGSPATSQANADPISSAHIHLLLTHSLFKALPEEQLNLIRKTMIHQEQMFKDQVQELHRVYNLQRTLMREAGISVIDSTRLSETRKGCDVQNVVKSLEINASGFNSEEKSGVHVEAASHAELVTKCKPTLYSSPSGQSTGITCCSDFLDRFKNGGDSTGKHKRMKMTIDLEKLPEECWSEMEDNQQVEPVRLDLPRNPTAKVSQSCESSTKFPQTKYTEDKVNIYGEKECFGEYNASLSNGVKLDTLPFEGSETVDETKDPLLCNQRSSTAELLINGRSRAGMKNDDDNMGDKKAKEKDNGGAECCKQHKQTFELGTQDICYQAETKLPWFLREVRTHSKNVQIDDHVKQNHASSPAFSRPHKWNLSSDDAELLDTNRNRENAVAASRKLEEFSNTRGAEEDKLMQSKEIFPAFLVPQYYGGRSKFTPLVFTSSYPMGTSIPAVALPWSLEEQQALSLSGSMFSTVGEANPPGKMPTSYNPGSFFQTFPYQKYATQNSMFSASSESGDRKSQLTGHERSHSDCVTFETEMNQNQNVNLCHLHGSDSSKETSTLDKSARLPAQEDVSVHTDFLNKAAMKQSYIDAVNPTENPDSKNKSLSKIIEEDSCKRHVEGKMGPDVDTAYTSRCGNHSEGSLKRADKLEEHDSRLNWREKLKTLEAFSLQGSTFNGASVDESDEKDWPKSKLCKDYGCSVFSEPVNALHGGHFCTAGNSTCIQTCEGKYSQDHDHHKLDSDVKEDSSARKPADHIRRKEITESTLINGRCEESVSTQEILKKHQVIQPAEQDSNRDMGTTHRYLQFEKTIEQDSDSPSIITEKRNAFNNRGQSDPQNSASASGRNQTNCSIPNKNTRESHKYGEDGCSAYAVEAENMASAEQEEELVNLAAMILLSLASEETASEVSPESMKTDTESVHRGNSQGHGYAGKGALKGKRGGERRQNSEWTKKIHGKRRRTQRRRTQFASSASIR